MLKKTNSGPSSIIVSIKLFGGVGLLLAMMTLQSCSKAEAGPNGGDVVRLNNGQVKAEVLANAETGEMMVHTWGQDLKTSQPIEAKPLTMGSGDKTIELQPHPTVSDPSGLCSRFYGQADWLRGGAMHHGWMSEAGQSRQEFAWNNCWNGGQSHSSMWSEMGDHRRGMMGPGQGSGMEHK